LSMVFRLLQIASDQAKLIPAPTRTSKPLGWHRAVLFFA
jgi:hypothetical protein